MMDVLTRPAEEFGNDETLEHLWAARAMEHSDIYFNVLCSVDTRWLRLTPHDDLIYTHFRQDFPDLNISNIKEEEIKNNVNKAKWRLFCEKFKNIVEDYSFGTLLRADTKGDYSEQNTILVPRVQFYAIEIARNREGLNNEVKKHYKCASKANMEAQSNAREKPLTPAEKQKRYRKKLQRENSENCAEMSAEDALPYTKKTSECTEQDKEEKKQKCRDGRKNPKQAQHDEAENVLNSSKNVNNEQMPAELNKENRDVVKREVVKLRKKFETLRKQYNRQSKKIQDLKKTFQEINERYQEITSMLNLFVMREMRRDPVPSIQL